MIKPGDVITVKLEYRICCDECNEVIGSYFEEQCPCCNKKYASTSINMYLNEFIGHTFTCNECDSKFKLLSEDYPDAVIEVIKVNVNER